MTNPKTGEKIIYRANSKHFRHVDPNVSSTHSIQYAGAHTVYLLLREKGSKKWVFPTRPMFERETFEEGKEILL